MAAIHLNSSSSNADILRLASEMPVVMRRKDPATLDDKDRFLLKMLQTDAEISMTEIGKNVGLTKMSVSNRIKRLKQEGILVGSHYKVNPQMVGRDYLIVSQVTCEVSGPDQEKVAYQIAKIPGVQSVYLTFGQYDILFVARAHDKQSAKDLVFKVTRIKGIRNTLTTIPHTVIKESLDVDLGDGVA